MKNKKTLNITVLGDMVVATLSPLDDPGYWTISQWSKDHLSKVILPSKEILAMADHVREQEELPVEAPQENTPEGEKAIEVLAELREALSHTGSIFSFPKADETPTTRAYCVYRSVYELLCTIRDAEPTERRVASPVKAVKNKDKDDD